MKSILVLKKRGVWEKKGNQILNDLLGADVRFVDSDSYDDVYAEMDRIAAELTAQGHKAYSIPVGGSVPIGSLGYVRCMKDNTVPKSAPLNKSASAMGMDPKISPYMGTPISVTIITPNGLPRPKAVSIHSAGIQL